MKIRTFVSLLAFSAQLFASGSSFALFKTAEKEKFLNERYEERVNELIKVEFLKYVGDEESKTDYLLEQLRELLDKDIKRI